MLTSLLPWWARWAALGAAILAAMAFGAAKTYTYEESSHAATLEKIHLAGDAQNAKTAIILAAQKSATLDAARSYDERIRSINDEYAIKLRDARAATHRRNVPAVSSAACGAPASAAHVEPAPASVNPGPTEQSIAFERDCTLTTQQLVSLQDWVRQQIKVSSTP